MVIWKMTEILEEKIERKIIWNVVWLGRDGGLDFCGARVLNP